MSNIRDRYTGVILLAFGVTLYLFIPTLVDGSKGLKELGPDFFPRILAIIIIVLSIIQIIQTLGLNSKAGNEDDKLENVEDNEESNIHSGRTWQSIVVFLLMLLYVFVMVEYLSFIVSTTIAMSIIMWVLSVRKWYFYVMVWVFIIALDFIFRNLLYVQLP